MYITDAMEYVKEKVDECSKLYNNPDDEYVYRNYNYLYFIFIYIIYKIYFMIYSLSLNQMKIKTFEISKQLVNKEKATMHQKLIEECMNYYITNEELNREAATLEQVNYYLK